MTLLEFYAQTIQQAQQPSSKVGGSDVFDRQPNAVVGLSDHDLHPACVRILVNIGQAFLHDAVQNDFRLAFQLLDQGVGAEIQFDAGSFGEGLDMPPQGDDQSEVVEHGGPQLI